MNDIRRLKNDQAARVLLDPKAASDLHVCKDVTPWGGSSRYYNPSGESASGCGGGDRAAEAARMVLWFLASTSPTLGLGQRMAR
jgi:hypothetical protein